MAPKKTSEISRNSTSKSAPGLARPELAAYLENELEVSRFKDYCPNGLQVEGKNRIERIVTGVTASLALIEHAIELKADAVLVHHGYFWRGEDARITGPKQARIKRLLQHDINLFAYHLPLDAHPQWGNNVQLGRHLGLQVTGQAGEQALVTLGRTRRAVKLAQLARLVQTQLGRTPLVIGAPDQNIKKIAWCTGAAQSMIEVAWAAGCDVYLSGEISEPTAHFCRETGMAYLACGHHATERYGVQALGQHLAQHFGLNHDFVDIDNPA
jgi:dinuclear metal center YbgI/SA1388 family protein